MTRQIVRAVPSRFHYHAYLKARLPDAEWSFEDRGFWRCLKAAFELQGADSAIHLEDDVILTREFEEKAEAAIAAHPDHVVQLFSQRKADLEVGSRWDRGAGFVNTQCFYVPAGLAPQLAAYYEWRGEPETKRADGVADLLIADYLKWKSQRYWIHVPSLVQHRKGPSVVGHNSGRWHSLSFVDPWE